MRLSFVCYFISLSGPSYYFTLFRQNGDKLWNPSKNMHINIFVSKQISLNTFCSHKMPHNSHTMSIYKWLCCRAQTRRQITTPCRLKIFSVLNWSSNFPFNTIISEVQLHVLLDKSQIRNYKDPVTEAQRTEYLDRTRRQNPERAWNYKPWISEDIINWTTAWSEEMKWSGTGGVTANCLMQIKKFSIAQ